MGITVDFTEYLGAGFCFRTPSSSEPDVNHYTIFTMREQHAEDCIQLGGECSCSLDPLIHDGACSCKGFQYRQFCVHLENCIKALAGMAVILPEDAERWVASQRESRNGQH